MRFDSACDPAAFPLVGEENFALAQNIQALWPREPTHMGLDVNRNTRMTAQARKQPSISDGVGGTGEVYMTAGFKNTRCFRAAKKMLQVRVSAIVRKEGAVLSRGYANRDAGGLVRRKVEAGTIDAKGLQAVNHPCAIVLTYNAQHGHSDSQLCQSARSDSGSAAYLPLKLSGEAFFPKFWQGIKFRENLVNEEFADHGDPAFLWAAHPVAIAILYPQVAP